MGIELITVFLAGVFLGRAWAAWIELKKLGCK